MNLRALAILPLWAAVFPALAASPAPAGKDLSVACPPALELSAVVPKPWGAGQGTGLRSLPFVRAELQDYARDVPDPKGKATVKRPGAVLSCIYQSGVVNALATQPITQRFDAACNPPKEARRWEVAKPGAASPELGAAKDRWTCTGPAAECPVFCRVER